MVCKVGGQKPLAITACKQYCLAPAHAGQHKATSPARKPLCLTLKDDRAKQLLTKKELKFVKNFALISKDN